MKATACALVLGAFSTVFALTLADCQQSNLVTCGEIPGNGCPTQNGGTCDDKTCPALYDCENGSWVLAQTCSNNQGASGGSGGGGAGGLGAGGCEMVNLDVGEQAMGCSADEQTPDCPVEAAETCLDSACLTGCCDFNACKAMPGGPEWVVVAYCNADGQLILETPDGGVPATRPPPRRR